MKPIEEESSVLERTREDFSVTHPSLKGKMMMWDDMCVKVVAVPSLQTHTVDKAVLNEVIDNLFPTNDNDDDEDTVHNRLLKRKLGLDDD